MGDDEMSLFLEEMAGVQPLKSNTTTTVSEKAVSTEAQDARRKQLQMSEQLALLTLDPHLVTASEPDAMVEFKRDGVQDEVFHRLSLGGYPCKFEVDLHMLKPQQAREALYQQIQIGRERGERNIMVIHGKGVKSKPFPALMKSFVINWLEQIDEVLAFHSAQRRHGGTGALYVMLAKSEQKRIEAKETNHKGVNVR